MKRFRTALSNLISAPDERIIINAGSLCFSLEKSELQRIADSLHVDSSEAGKAQKRTCWQNTEVRSSPDAECRVYGWMTDDGIIRLWTDAGAIRLAGCTAEMFSNLPSVTRMMRSPTSGTD